ncbi:MAG: VOC family protein [Candidatus Aminicenantales bacterium]
MPEIKTRTQGMFYWTDLVTTDAEGAKSFYQELFGWTAVDQPMGEGLFYTLLQKNGKDVCALYPMNEEQKKHGVPPHWLTYIYVKNVDETAAKVAPAGGRILMEPFDVFDAGRMAVLQDPSGAVVALWQAKAHQGAELFAEHGALGWTELLTRETEKAENFYKQILGYETEHQQMGPTEYIVFKAEDQPAAGMMEIAPEWGDVPPHWMVYFVVDACEATVERAQQLGARVLVPPTDIPEVGSFATLQDPQGAVFSVFQMPQQT